MAAKRRSGHGGARPGAGRKPKALAHHRRNRIMLNLTDAERVALNKAAGKRSLSDYARAVLLEHLKSLGDAK